MIGHENQHVFVDSCVHLVVSEIDWTGYLDLKKTFSVQAIVN